MRQGTCKFRRAYWCGGASLDDDWPQRQPPVDLQAWEHKQVKNCQTSEVTSAYQLNPDPHSRQEQAQRTAVDQIFQTKADPRRKEKVFEPSFRPRLSLKVIHLLIKYFRWSVWKLKRAWTVKDSCWSFSLGGLLLSDLNRNKNLASFSLPILNTHIN